MNIQIRVSDLIHLLSHEYSSHKAVKRSLDRATSDNVTALTAAVELIRELCYENKKLYQQLQDIQIERARSEC
jgi:hypothetical protein